MLYQKRTVKLLPLFIAFVKPLPSFFLISSPGLAGLDHRETADPWILGAGDVLLKYSPAREDSR
jgi:hypothetical protein